MRIIEAKTEIDQETFEPFLVVTLRLSKEIINDKHLPIGIKTNYIGTAFLDAYERYIKGE